jgi:enoyl-CoA hydratase
MSDDPLLVAERDAVLWLTINRPRHANALTLSLLDDIGEALASRRDAEQLRGAVITAAGEKCFAAGGDLKELDPLRSTDEARAMSRRVRAALDCIRSFPLPVVAALNGLALGGGAELALACDLRVAMPHAEIGFLQSQLSLTTAWGGGIDLIATVGYARALDLLLSARRVGVEEALAIGLVNRVAGEDQSLDGCLEELLAAWRTRGPQVMRGFKALAGDYRRSLHERLADGEEARFIETWVHPDHWDAVNAAQAKRQGRKKQR